MTYRCMIIDDEPLARRIVEKFLDELPQWELVASAGNAIDALEFLTSDPVDVLLLDINMPELSGINMLRSMPQPPKVIFITAYAEHAVEGFELEAVDFVLKPFAKERLFKALAKAAKVIELEKTQQHIAAPDALLVKADKKLFRVKFETIRYLEAYGDYVKIHLAEERIMPKDKLTNLEAKLPKDQFMRIHRSFIVALNAVEFIEGNQVMIDGQKIPISAQYKDQLIQRLA
ncbi:MAG: LytTR family DNA-binding domain-containing protein [Bacteroidota bacterium]